MFKWLVELFTSKKSAEKPSYIQPTVRPIQYMNDAAVSRAPARTAKSQPSSTRRMAESNSRNDDYLHNPLNPMNPIGFNSPIYYDSTPSYSSHSSCSSSSSYDSGSSSSDSSSSGCSSD